MSKVCAFVAEGFEEVECLSVVDILRRAKVNVKLVSITDSTEVTGSHQIKILADACFSEVDFSDCDLLFLPGGVPGTPNLAACKPLTDLLCRFAKEGRRISAICAAPSVLGDLGLLSGVTATCYPGWEDHLKGANLSPLGVVTDGNFTTGRGMGYAVDLGLELVSILCSPDLALQIKKGIQHPNA
ncbi:MAG: DJ-1/PfpI family protein [Clostridia bacterium]|nr:DJ-1/PfpI family protein [Clostridia bacterium]